MVDRFKFKAVLKTSEFTILVEPYYILEGSYFIDINQAETEFENKYPEECFWDFIDEIEKQDYVQEISSDSDLIITKDFTNLIQCTGLKDKNGKLIYEGDILGGTYGNLYIHYCDNCKQFELKAKDYGCMACEGDVHWGEVVEDNNELEVIGNIYENPELLEE